MVFANLTYDAFFSLLDEYFASRPQHANGGSSAGGGPSLATLARMLPPTRSASNSSPSTSATSPRAPAGAQGQVQAQEQPDMAQRFISSTIKYGTAGTKSGIGAISKNKDAMDLLGKMGAAGMVKGADARMNPKTQVVEETATIEEIPSGGGGGRSKPAPPPKKSGVAGLISGKSFGHVDTSSKMSAFTSMWKDPQKVQQPVAEQHIAPALSNQRTTMPPPVRQSSNQSARSPPPVEDYSEDQGQAQALYDYAGTGPEDLRVQASQVVNIIEKTSADWWTCEDGNGSRGLVPATYLKEL
ncbi:hypothetical protein IAU60_002943 [Kwoniella sp. DSM 27419]